MLGLNLNSDKIFMCTFLHQNIPLLITVEQKKTTKCVTDFNPRKIRRISRKVQSTGTERSTMSSSLLEVGFPSKH